VSTATKVFDFWHSRWQAGRHGWHEAAGNAALKKYWPRMPAGSRVLVPLCGKSVDILYLARQGLLVTGVELSTIAARAFFEEAGLTFDATEQDGFSWFRGRDSGIAIACGNYFEFSDRPFDALYDRAALSAIAPAKRPEYARHTQGLLKPGAFRMLVTLEFDETGYEGPPYAVWPDEIRAYWSDLQRSDERGDTDNRSAQFLDAGVERLMEVVWVSA